MAEKDCFYAQNDQQLGPVSIDELAQLARAGRLGRDDLVWRPGMDDWTPAGQMKDLYPQRSTPARRSDPSAPPIQNGPVQKTLSGKAKHAPVRAGKTPAEAGPVKIPVAPQVTPTVDRGESTPASAASSAAIEPMAELIDDESSNHQGPEPAIQRPTSSGNSAAMQAQPNGAPARIAVWLAAAAVLMTATAYLIIRWLLADTAAAFGDIAGFVLAVDAGTFLLAFAIDRAIDLGTTQE